MARQQIAQFVGQFLPKSEPQELGDGMKIYISPHGLLYDFEGRYPHRFSIKQLIDCLDGYLALIDPVIKLIDQQEDTRVNSNTNLLYKIRHDDASELLLAYIRRTNKDDDYPSLLQHIVEIDAVSRVEHLLHIVDPNNKAYGVDCRKRIASVLSILEAWQKEYHENEI